MLFERAHATAPWTLPSVASALTGRLPSHHGAVIAAEPGPQILRELEALGYLQGSQVEGR